jgi:hypothetical protein
MCGCIDCTNIRIPVGPAGATGATGAAGSNGSNGTTVLHNDISDNATIGVGLEILKTYTLPLNTLTTDGSFLEVRSRFRTTYPTLMTSLKSVQMDFNGSLLNGYPFIQLTVTSVEFITIIERVNNTTAKYKVYIEAYDQNGVSTINITSDYDSTAGLNFTTTAYDITAKANSDVIGDITCEYLTVLKYTK